MFEIVEVVGDERGEFLHLDVFLEVEIGLDEGDDVSAELFVKVLGEVVELAEFPHDDSDVFLGGGVIGLDEDELVPVGGFFAAFAVDFDVFEELDPGGEIFLGMLLHL